jgi:hypothetical protein
VMLIGRAPAISRSYAFAVARLLGHSSPSVSMGHYVHASDLILRAITRRECLKLPVNLLQAASGLQKSAFYERLSLSIDKVAEASRQHFYGGRLDNVDANSSAIRRGRPPREPAYLQPTWTPLEKIQKLLAYTIDDHESPDDVANLLVIDRKSIEHILQEACVRGPSIGLKLNDAGALLDAPGPIRERVANEFCLQLEKSVATLHRSSPEQCAHGIDIFLEHYDRDNHDVVFRGAKHLDALKEYLLFIKLLGLDSNNFCWVIRTPNKNELNLPKWIPSMSRFWRPQSIKSIRPKTISRANTYSSWAGILAMDSMGKSLGYSMAKTLFFAKLSISAKSE